MTATIREAAAADLPRLIALLHQLSLDGESREDLSLSVAKPYLAAFDQIQADPRQRLLVAEQDGAVVGTAVLIVVPNLSHVGRPYAIIEDVVVDAYSRGEGIGESLIRYMVEESRRAGCYKVVLTSNKARSDAHRFYRRRGFTASHEGFRMDLPAE